ncbi:hypothetical protein SISNIDRAFT_313510 [Sistotremastrum niveocremeum HHB9708]|uniref:Uncharacterized protein n=1 Tax=Sistotremastrum niveocremeum HHB9708 TaxID=1314777 RepID=A0A164XXW4_9AGAM|nr:hypothetical protein SISNIDRAFT_313510 [Sistotremastrum niveocremeum HHB9708]
MALVCPSWFRRLVHINLLLESATFPLYRSRVAHPSPSPIRHPPERNLLCNLLRPNSIPISHSLSSSISVNLAMHSLAVNMHRPHRHIHHTLSLRHRRDHQQSISKCCKSTLASKQIFVGILIPIVGHVYCLLVRSLYVSCLCIRGVHVYVHYNKLTCFDLPSRECFRFTPSRLYRRYDIITGRARGTTRSSDALVPGWERSLNPLRKEA